MIVTCERCATQFQLDDSRVPARGVRVRCSRCKNAFRVVPPGQSAAEEATELARRAREDGQEEITQDLDGDSRGDSRSRSGSRRGEGSGKGSESKHGSSGSGLETEESDWKFNEDVSADAEAPIRSKREELKPEPPSVRRGAEADDWFRGGSDASLELEDRPWNASPEEAAPPESEVQQAAERMPEPQPEAEPTHAPAAEAEPSLDRFVEPDEPESHLGAEAPATDEFDSLKSFDASEPAAEAGEASGSTDELSSESWDHVFGEALQADGGETAALEAPSKRRRRRSLSLPSFGSFGGVGAQVGRWLGYGAQAFGWLVTTALFGAGLYAGFAAQIPSQRAPAAQQVGGLELAALEGRFVENVVSGRIYVVSGRVRNPGRGMEMLGLEVELLDAAGQPIGSERAALHAPIQKSALRESPLSDLLAPRPPSVPLGPGEERAVEGLFATLPADAAAFRVVASRHAPGAGGALPVVDLPR